MNQSPNKAGLYHDMSKGDLEIFKKPPMSAMSLLQTRLERDTSKENIGIVSAKDLPL